MPAPTKILWCSKTFRRKALLVLLVALFCLYVLLAPPIAWPIYNTILFRPTRQAAPAADRVIIEKKYHARLTEITFPSRNGSILHGRFFELPGTDRVFIASEGCGSNIYHRINHAQFLLQCGGSVLQYDYQGYGSSEGAPTIEGTCDDAVAAYDYLVKNHHKRPNQIVLYGESYGTGVTGQLVARRPVGGVILHSGFTSLLRASRDFLPWLKLYPDTLFPKQMLDTASVFERPHPPLLIIHGDKDWRVLYKNAVDLNAGALEPKVLLTVPGGGHSAFGYHAQNSVEAFLRKYKL